MSNENNIDFQVRIKRDGVREVAQDLNQLEAGAKSLTETSKGTGTALDKMSEGAKDAGTGMEAAGRAADQTGAEIKSLRSEIDAKSAAIKAGLELEKSEIELQNQQLIANRSTQQAVLQAAQAKGDEAAATRAQNALRQIESDQLHLVAQAKRAEATAISQATAARREEFSTIGPLTDAQDKELRAADNLARALRVEAAAAETASQRAKELRKAHDDGSQAAEKLSGRVATLKDMLGQMAATVAVGFGFRELVTAAAQLEQMRSGLAAVSQDTALAGQQLEFVRGVANRIGADVLDVGKAFLGLAASTKGTAVEGEVTREVFEAVATAMGKAGKSSAETSNALLALSQMASKGTIQMEELRGQLGEALPGALQAVARGLGITTQDLIQLVEEGKIAASDLFPALAKGLNELYGGAPSAQTLSQEITNIKNAFTEMAADIGDAGGLSALKVGAEIAQAAIVSLGVTLVAAGKSIGVLAGAIATWDFSQLKQSFADIEQEAKDKLLKAAQHNETLRKAIEQGGDEAAKAALAQQQLSIETQKAGAAAQSTANDFVKLQKGYALVYEFVRGQIAEAEKSVAARDAEGKAAIELAASFGTETQQRQANAKATADNAAQLENLARLKMTELDSMKAELKSLRDEAAALKIVDEEKLKQIKKLEDQIALRQQDADKAMAQAQSSRIAAEAAQYEADAQKDNSSRVQELALAYDQARQKLEQVKAAKAASKASSDDLSKAELEAGRAARLYRDALEDQVRALEAKTRAQQADVTLTTSALQVELAQERAKEATARAEGNLAAVTDSKIRQKQIEIKIIEATIKAQLAEAEGAIAVSKAKLAELDVTDKGNAVKRLELETAIKLAQARINQAKATGESTKLLQADIDALRNGTNLHHAAAQSIDMTTAAMGRLNTERERAIQLQERENDLATRELKLQEAKRNVGTTTGSDSVPSFETQAQADAWLKEWKEQYQRENPFSTKSGGTLGNFMYDMTMFEWNKEIDAMKLRNTMKGDGNAETSSKTPLESMRQQPQVFVNNIQLPGLGQTVVTRHADAQSAMAENDLLQRLVRAKSSSI